MTDTNILDRDLTIDEQKDATVKMIVEHFDELGVDVETTKYVDGCNDVCEDDTNIFFKLKSRTNGNSCVFTIDQNEILDFPITPEWIEIATICLENQGN